MCVWERETECPSQWVGSVLLVLVQWARPCIRQVELQGEFCNTWPVSLSHLCGWRRAGMTSRERAREGRAAQVVRGDWRDEWQWKVIARGRENNSWGSRREEKWDDSALKFLTLSLHPRPSFSSLSGRLGWVAPFLITHPFNLKGQKHKLGSLKCKNIKLYHNLTVATCCWWCFCACTHAHALYMYCMCVCCWKYIWCSISA